MMSESDSHRVEADVDGSVAILLVRAGQHALRAVDAALAPFHVSVTQYLVLAYVARDDAPTAGALARHANLDSGAMTRLLDRMEEQGLLARRLDAGDRRVVRLSMTDHGRRMLPGLNHAIVHVHDALAHAHSGTELERFMAYLHGAIGAVTSLKEKP
jgi:DNA-binding MarR family transcriptional regulator